MSGVTITMTRTDPRDVPTYKHLESSKSFFAGKLSANMTAVTPSPETYEPIRSKYVIGYMDQSELRT